MQFNPDSKYINKEAFDLDHYDSIEFEYKIKKVEEEEEKKKENEEEDDGRMTLAKCLKKFCKEEQLWLLHKLFLNRGRGRHMTPFKAVSGLVFH